MKKLWNSLAVLTATFLLAGQVLAHSDGEDYFFVNFNKDEIVGEFQVNLDDLREKLNLDIAEDTDKANEQIKQTASTVQAYLRDNFRLTPKDGAPYEFQFGEAEIFVEADRYARYPFVIPGVEPPEVLTIEHNLFYENDKTHRGLFLIQYNVVNDTDYGEEYTALIFSPTNATQVLDLNDVPGLIERKEMFYQGMVHIWGGLDHILFILALILPTVLVRSGNSWQPAPRAWPVFKRLVGIITIFTVAHSITLVLAALDLVTVNSRLVESFIALSIILVALNNIFYKLEKGSLWVIFLLGLFHGLGFATVMGNLPFRMEDLVKMVIRFNIGVEIGQIVIIMVIFPLLFMLRGTPAYVRGILQGGSWVLVLIASYWFVERAFDLG